MKQLLVAIMGAAIFMGLGPAWAAEPYYAGKTVTFVVSAPPGGASDLTCRVLAQYLPDLIPGKPTIIVKSMAGAASMIASNYVGLQAKPDGLTLLCGVVVAANQLTHQPGLKFDLTKFDYVLGEGNAQVVYVRSDVKPGIKSPADFLNAQGVVLGGQSAQSVRDIALRLAVELLGIKKYGYVTGLEGDTGGRTAIEQNFINVFLETADSYRDITVPALVKPGTVTTLFQTGDPDAQGHLTIRDSVVSDLPTFDQYYDSLFGKAPAGNDLDLYESLMALWATSSQVLALPPGVPQEASDIFHQAVPKLNADAAYLAAAAKLRGDGAQETPGDQVQHAVNGFLHMSPALLTRYNDLVQSGTQIATSHQ